jgi:hypothetical protein
MEEAEWELIEQVLREALPDECQTIGPTNTRDIARRGGRVSIVSDDAGSRIDFSTILAIVANAAVVVSQALVIINSLRDKKSLVAAEVGQKLPAEARARVDDRVYETLISALVAAIGREERTKQADAEGKPTGAT